ncbi:hypothetical protein N657DRAFT_643164 [Parathielavia appendiculata]|uniref:Uncharacterized protein n=1 Tax=Parathielavia appendiculata TaxID=2587402 RepID=A0AAN6U4M5_9PEZI|nr:hypothetical protein N657DRAFT_643164 [Parathielavia appendiculata]
MASNDDDDPVVASYCVFIKPPLPEHRNLVVLQYVTRTAQDASQVRIPRITELRVKPSTGMYEVDVPMDTGEAYDKNKGMAWGTALQKSMEAKKGGSLGLAGGFNIVATPSTGRGGRRAGNDDEAPPNWAEALRQDKVLRTQTFGGSRSAEEKHTRHMIGVFQGKNLHLTPVSSAVHLRPVPHHLDAATEQDRLSRGSAAGGVSGEKSGAAAAASAARAIHMSIKSAMDAEGGVETETMADRLRNVQTETWKRMEWVHDEAEMAWEAYNECLLLRPESNNNAAATTTTTTNTEQTEEDKGKGKAVEGSGAAAATVPAAADESGAADLVEKVAQLKTDWGEQELLRAINGVAAEVEGQEKGKGKGKPTVVKTEEQQQQPAQAGGAGRNAGAGSAGAAAGAAGTRRTTRGRATNKTAAMEID